MLELLQFGGLISVVALVALLWFVFVYKARRTGEGDGTPRGGHSENSGPPDKNDGEESG